LILKRGAFSMFLTDVPIDKIESISCRQGFLGLLFKYGTVFVSGVGGKLGRFRTVKRPLVVRRKIYEVMEKNRRITIVRKENLPRLPPPRNGTRNDIDYGLFVTAYPPPRLLPPK
jgi:hypothetical protein